MLPRLDDKIDRIAVGLVETRVLSAHGIELPEEGADPAILRGLRARRRAHASIEQNRRLAELLPRTIG